MCNQLWWIKAFTQRPNLTYLCTCQGTDQSRVFVIKMRGNPTYSYYNAQISIDADSARDQLLVLQSFKAQDTLICGMLKKWAQQLGQCHLLAVFVQSAIEWQQPAKLRTLPKDTHCMYVPMQEFSIAHLWTNELALAIKTVLTLTWSQMGK